MQERPADVTDALAWCAPAVPAVARASLLHEQLRRLADLAEPSAAVLKQRRAAVCRATCLVQRALGGAFVAVKVFGSATTDLSLPGSDIDLTVCIDDDTLPESSEWAVREGWRTPRFLRDRAFAMLSRIHECAELDRVSDLEFIRAAKVPVIKFCDGPSGLAVDLSVDAADGPRSSSTVRSALDETPAVRPLVLALKTALAQVQNLGSNS